MCAVLVHMLKNLTNSPCYMYSGSQITCLPQPNSKRRNPPDDTEPKAQPRMLALIRIIYSHLVNVTSFGATNYFDTKQLTSQNARLMISVEDFFGVHSLPSPLFDVIQTWIKEIA